MVDTEVPLPKRIAFLKTMKAAATSVNHPWPGAAAAEAAVETGWGVHIPKGSSNVLGIKAYHGWPGKTVGADGTEQKKDGSWTGPQADQWCVFNSPADCFAEQIKILTESRYVIASAATTIESYIIAECKVWSTGILKGVATLQTYNAHKDILA